MSTQTARNTQMSEAMNETLESRIDETGRLVRKVDFSLSVLTLLSIVFVVLLLSILADHWLFTDGLPPTLRLGIFLGLAGVAVFFVYRRIVPLFLYPINPVYSASILEAGILEEGAPSLKNSIINWILLRREREEREGETDRISDRMFDGVTRSAASGMSAIPSDRAVDLRGIAHWGITLTLIFLLFVAYGIFSPKSPMTSLARIMLPLSHIRPPQEIQFHAVEPGNAVAQQGEHLTVSAELVGRTVGRNPGREPVYVFFSTDDGQAVWQAVPMTLPEGKIRHEAPFPPGKHGFVSGVDYWLQQGESRSEKYRIEVRPIASIEVASLTYQYPEYTGLAGEVVENSGDIRGVEGTEVKVAVRSTLPLQRVDLVMDNDPAKATTMRLLDETEAVTTLTLRHDPENQTPTSIHSYTFRATDLEGYESRRSGVFRLEVLPDRPPIVQWSDTDEKLKDAVEIEVPLNGSLELPIQAEDPDFGLRYLRFHVESGNKRIRPVELLESASTGPTKHNGPIRAKTVFSPAASRLAEGDTAEIRVEAIDTKLPEPNVTVTRTITIRVGAPKKQEEKPKQEEKESKEEKQDGKEDKEKDKDKDQGENEKENDKKTDDDEKPAEDSEGEKSEDDEKSQNADDSGKRDPEDGGEEKGDSGKDDKKDAEKEQKTGEPDENMEDPTGDRQQDEERGKPSGEEQSGDEQSAENKNDDKSSAENSDKNQKKDEKPGDEQKRGDDDEQQQQQSKDGCCDKKVDPNTQDGDAMERILDQMKKENKLPGDQKNEQKQDSADEGKDSSKQDQKQESGEDKPKDSKPEPQQQKQEQEQKPQQQKNKDCENGDCNKSDCQKCNGGGGGEQKEGQSGGGNQGGQEGNEQNSSPEGGGGSDGSKADSGGDKQDSSGGDQDGGADGTQKTEKESNQSGKPEDGSKDDSKGGAESNEQSGKQQGDESEGGQGGGGEQSPGKKTDGDSTSGGGGQGDKNSAPSSKKGDNRNNDGEDIPVDPNDTEARERDRSLDPNMKDRRSQGGDSTKPKQSDETAKDVPQNTTSSGDEGKGQETRQQGRSDRTQSAEDGDMEGDQGESGMEKEGGDQGTGRQQEKEGGDSRAGTQEGTQQGEPGEQSEQNGAMPGSKSSEGEPQQSAPAGSQQPGEGDPADSGSTVGPGGEGGTGARPETPTPKEDANLEYTEKVTNLVLEYLEDQLRDKPDQELLDNLGWTEEELRGFYRKWKEMSQQQRQPTLKEDADSGEAWKEALKSLGLRPAKERQGQRQSHTEFKDAGSSAESLRYAPPKALQKRFQRYTEGIGTGGKRE